MSDEDGTAEVETGGEAEEETPTVLVDRSPPAELDVSVHLREMEQGGSDSQLFRAENGSDYVTKFKNNPQGRKILANEYMVAELGRLVGAPYPESALLRVSEEIIGASEIKFNGEMAESGIQFGSQYMANDNRTSANDPNPAQISDFINPEDIPALIVMDTLTLNDDQKTQHIVFYPEGDGYRFWAVDYGHCLGITDPWSDLEPTKDEIVAPIEPLRERVQGPQPFEDPLEVLESEVNTEVVKRIAEEMPLDEWGVDHAELGALAAFVDERRNKVRDILEGNRSMFPNWIEEEDANEQEGE